MTWAQAPFAISPWGGGGLPVSVQDALAITTRTVRVTLTDEPRHRSALARGDALNPSSWTVQRLDTLAPYQVLQVDAVDEPLVFDLQLAHPLAGHLIEHQVSSLSLLTPNGDLLTPPRSANFLGVLWSQLATPAAIAANRRVSASDIANPQLPPGSVSLGGTLIITAAHDYATDDGVALVRKLIIRRLITPTGGFFHLPGYGIGLPHKLPVSPSDLPRLKAEIERQCRLEPEVDQVVARLRLERDVLTIVVKAQLRATGQQVDVTFQASPQGGLVIL